MTGLTQDFGSNPGSKLNQIWILGELCLDCGGVYVCNFFLLNLRIKGKELILLTLWHRFGKWQVINKC